MRVTSLRLGVVVSGLCALVACSDGGCDDEPKLIDAPLVDGGDDHVIATPTPNPSDAADDAPPDPPCPDAGTAAPQELRCTGLYASFSRKTIAPDVRPYTPGAPFWSDGAAKQRWIYLPPGTTIDTSDMDDWVFPVGTKVWKEFSIGGVRIETRIFWKTSPTTWVRTTYRWSADGQSSATRLDVGAQNVVGTYEIPQSIDCDTCHSGKKDRLLGIELVSLGLPSASGLTLATLASEGRLSAAPPATTVALPNDSTGAAPAALGWLHSNCGPCHARTPNALAFFTGLSMRLTSKQLYPDAGAAAVKDLDTYATAANVGATQPPYLPLGFSRIAPHDPDHSLVVYLAGRRDPVGDAGIETDAEAGALATGQMPPLATHVVDDAGVGAVRAWIAAMPDGGL